MSSNYRGLQVSLEKSLHRTGTSALWEPSCFTSNNSCSVCSPTTQTHQLLLILEAFSLVKVKHSVLKGQTLNHKLKINNAIPLFSCLLH